MAFGGTPSHVPVQALGTGSVWLGSGAGSTPDFRHRSEFLNLSNTTAEWVNRHCDNGSWIGYMNAHLGGNVFSSSSELGQASALVKIHCARGFLPIKVACPIARAQPTLACSVMLSRRDPRSIFSLPCRAIRANPINLCFWETTGSAHGESQSTSATETNETVGIPKLANCRAQAWPACLLTWRQYRGTRGYQSEGVINGPPAAKGANAIQE